MKLEIDILDKYYETLNGPFSLGRILENAVYVAEMVLGYEKPDIDRARMVTDELTPLIDALDSIHYQLRNNQK
jgi:hypothetical protein